MKNSTWIPNVDEIVAWGCDAVKVISVDFGGRIKAKMIETNKIVKNIDISEVQKIC